ncbi:MAG: hypothetical protein L0170_08860, partial [Acidobacteria bacterium]|nr:hypothetical protein [Acidobacteriota bacterium]
MDDPTRMIAAAGSFPVEGLGALPSLAAGSDPPLVVLLGIESKTRISLGRGLAWNFCGGGVA